MLVADEDAVLEPLVRQQFRNEIRDGEFDFVFARDGQEALEKLQADPQIELLLTEISMPVMDGWTLLSRLADLGRPVKAVVLSADGEMGPSRSRIR